MLAMDDNLGISWKETDVAHFLEKNHASHEKSQNGKFYYQDSNWRPAKYESEV
jgi:hypothetical protein